MFLQVLMVVNSLSCQVNSIFDDDIFLDDRTIRPKKLRSGKRKENKIRHVVIGYKVMPLMLRELSRSYLNSKMRLQAFRT